MLLQSCTGLSNPSIAREKRQTDNIERAGNQGSISKKLNHREPLYQTGSRLQAIGREKLPEGKLTKLQPLGYGYIGKERFKRVAANDQEKVKKKREKGGNGSQTTKRKEKKFKKIRKRAREIKNTRE
ncbi:MAG: hypothetical protein ACYC2U_02810 [Candidatus Amoebophilus sp.]